MNAPMKFCFFPLDGTSLMEKTLEYKQYFLLGHTTYTRNNMGQKCKGNCGLWVLNEILEKNYLEISKK